MSFEKPSPENFEGPAYLRKIKSGVELGEIKQEDLPYHVQLGLSPSPEIFLHEGDLEGVPTYIRRLFERDVEKNPITQEEVKLILGFIDNNLERYGSSSEDDSSAEELREILEIIIHNGEIQEICDNGKKERIFNFLNK